MSEFNAPSRLAGSRARRSSPSIYSAPFARPPLPPSCSTPTDRRRRRLTGGVEAADYEEEFRGEVPVRQAPHSMNTRRSHVDGGRVKAAGMGHNLGLSTKINEDLSMALALVLRHPVRADRRLRDFARLEKRNRR